MAKKKAAKKASPKKKAPMRKVAPSKKAQAEFFDEQAACGTLDHQIHLHNISKKAANWSLSGGGNRVRGVTPPESESTLRATHAKRYKITFWVKPDKKESANLGPDGSAIYNGRKIFVTHPH